MELCEDKLSWIDLAPDDERPWRDFGVTDAETMIRGGYWRPMAIGEEKSIRGGGYKTDEDGNMHRWIVVPRRSVDLEMNDVGNEIAPIERPQDILADSRAMNEVEQSLKEIHCIRKDFRELRILQREIEGKNKNEKSYKFLYDSTQLKIHKMHPVIRAIALMLETMHNLDQSSPSYDTIKSRMAGKIADHMVQVQKIIDTKTGKFADIIMQIMRFKLSQDKPIDEDTDSMSDAQLIEEAKSEGIEL
jgi:hypothetical protein